MYHVAGEFTSRELGLGLARSTQLVDPLKDRPGKEPKKEIKEVTEGRIEGVQLSPNSITYSYFHTSEIRRGGDVTKGWRRRYGRLETEIGGTKNGHIEYNTPTRMAINGHE